MTEKISTGKHGGNTWDINFQKVEADNPIFSTKHELRRSVEGRKYLVETGVSMKGYKRGQGNYSAIPFTERRFVSWDGEGARKLYGPECEICEHVSCYLIRYYESSNVDDSHYVLFGNSDGDFLHSPSLSTVECLSLIIEKAHIDAIHFGFAFDYDVNMIIKDLSPNHLRILADKGSVLWKRFRIEYLPKKWFLVTDREIGRTVRIWDVWTFFMSSAVKAWEQYGIPVSDAVIEGKKARGSQSYLNVFPEMFQYWQEENDAYVELVTKLRQSLHSAGLYISAWHGPGAIASYSMSKNHIAQAMAKAPESVNEAAQYAYGGGRFELFKVGRINQPVYEYDVNSAYPYAISQLPNLARGHWRHTISPRNVEKFGVYRITWAVNPFEDNNFHRPMPFFHRDYRGQISFPCVNETWVWSPELAGKMNFPGLTVHEGWEFIEDDPADKPFSWLAEIYAIRMLYKTAGNQAEYALKLLLNSMYGKMAQRVGWNQEKRIAPKWHQLEWAGWVTSYCRAMVFRASLHAGDGLISFETDAVFTTKRLAGILDIGSDLGKWEETRFDDFVYLQSGCRFGLKEGVWKEKYRGFDKGSITLDETLTALANPNPDEWQVSGKTSRFIGFRQALHTKFDTWRQFQTDKDRIMQIGGEGKRKHVPKLCYSCRTDIPASEMAHDCALGSPVGGESYKHPLPWKDAELLMTQVLADEEKWDVNVNA
jgi:hypothetical protein